MFANFFPAAARAILVVTAFVALLAPAQAQQPSANAIALAKEIITVKGSANMFDPILPNLVDKTRAMLLQTNPMLSKELNEVAAKLRTEMSSRTSELQTERSEEHT